MSAQQPRRGAHDARVADATSRRGDCHCLLIAAFSLADMPFADVLDFIFAAMRGAIRAQR